MPQIQVLPAVPTFGSKLAQAIGGAVGDVGEAHYKKKGVQEARTALDKLFNSPQQNPPPPAGQNTAPGQGTPDTINQPPPKLNINQIPQVYDLAKKGYGEDVAKEMIQNIRDQSKLHEKEAQMIRAEDRKTAHEESNKLDKIQKDIVDGYDSARVSDANLNKMQSLIDSDKIISPLGAYLTDLLGAPVSLTSNADTEEFQKLAAQRGLNVASAYGFGRILQTEFTEFLKTIPSLLNSKDGKERIIHTLRYFDNLAKARYEVFKDARKNRTGKERASDIELDISERMQPYYDKFAQVLQYGDELVPVISPDGKQGKIPKNQVQEAIQDYGYKLQGQ